MSRASIADTAWAAFMRRDRGWDGRVIGAVKTTGIYCKPSCPARRPKREHVEFFATAEEARAAGFRSCLRCKPDEVGRDREAVAAAVKLIEQAEEAPTLARARRRRSAMRRTISSASSSATLACPRRNMRAALRNRRAEGALKPNGRVTDAVYDAGYAGPSGFYSDAKERLGMTPSAWRDGGRGETIRWTHFDSPLGPDADRGDEQGHLPADLRRQRGLAPPAASRRRRSSRMPAPFGSLSKARSPRSSSRLPRATCRSTSPAPPSRKRSGAS